MSSAEWFFLTCAVVGGIVFIIRMILFFAGMGDSGDVGDLSGAEASGMDHAPDEGFQYLSLQGMSAFFMMFGLVGLTLLRGGAGVLWAFAGAIASGVVTVWLISRLFISMIRLQSDGTMRIQNAVGQEGTVYLTIPAEGSGQVQVAVQGSLRIFEARSASRDKIPTGERVRVVDIVAGNILVVERSLL